MIRAVLTILALALSGCSSESARAPVVLAAASLQDALTEAADAWAKQGHEKPVLSFAASSALARQVESGAPADLFVSADEEWMDKLAAAKLIDTASRMSFLGNRLVLIAPVTSTAKLVLAPGAPLSALLGDGRIALADPDAVPAGRYAKAAFTSLGLWDGVANRIAVAENVRAALVLVERGEAPLGVVYATDAAASKKVRVVAIFPESSHPTITYPVALLRTARAAEADAFRRYLIGPAQPIFRSHGFTTLPPR